jgi:hypothetical protein
MSTHVSGSGTAGTGDGGKKTLRKVSSLKEVPPQATSIESAVLVTVEAPTRLLWMSARPDKYTGYGISRKSKSVNLRTMPSCQLALARKLTSK